MQRAKLLPIFVSAIVVSATHAQAPILQKLDKRLRQLRLSQSLTPVTPPTTSPLCRA
jgi:hypothetical protein